MSGDPWLSKQIGINLYEQFPLKVDRSVSPVAVSLKGTTGCGFGVSGRDSGNKGWRAERLGPAICQNKGRLPSENQALWFISLLGRAAFPLILVSCRGLGTTNTRNLRPTDSSFSLERAMPGLVPGLRVTLP